MRKLLILALVGASACSAPQNLGTPERPDRPAAGADGFQVAADARVLAGREARLQLPHNTRYTLPQLIDIAQRNNPSTRAAWLRATQAAEAVGLVQTSYLPRINAQILAGAGQTESMNAGLGPIPGGTVNATADRLSARLTMEWLLFDFGKRAALREQAQELAFAANVGFNGTHQKLIFEVSQAYHDLHAATRRQAVQQRRLANARQIQASAQAKRGEGIATVTTVAQAGQAVAQARFDLARAQSATRAARTSLLTRMGLSPNQSISPIFPDTVTLPRTLPQALDSHIEQSLMRRPDLQAAFARARAREQNVAAVEAEFRPKIVAVASLGQGIGQVDVDDARLPGGDISLSRNEPTLSGFIGITIPLWDGGAKERRLKIAQAESAAAQAEADNLRLLAEGEIVGAYELLQTSIAANTAARELIATSRVSYRAAVNFEKEGLATLTDVTLARQLLYDAEIMQIEAQHAAMSAALTLAFASGQVG